jgi:hypothetical protein
MTTKENRAAFAAIFLISTWIASVLPLPILIYEFGNISFCEGTTTVGHYLATYYGSMYVYPISIGVFFMLALYVPFSATVERITRAHILWIGGLILALTVGGLCLVEFIGSPSAIFEISPEVLRAPQGQSFLAKYGDFCKAPLAQKHNFVAEQRDIDGLISLGKSYSAYVYYVGVAGGVTAQLTLFLSSVRFCTTVGDKSRALLYILKILLFFYLAWQFYLVRCGAFFE